MKKLIAIFLSLAAVIPLASHAVTADVFGPETFVRASAEPIAVERVFAVTDPAADYFIEVVNGMGVSARVSSAVISLNGVELVLPSDFSQQVELIEMPIRVQEENILSIEVRGIRGSALSVRIYTIRPPQVSVTSPTNESFVAVDEITIVGITDDPTASISVDGIPVTNDSGSFRLESYILDPGLNVIPVAATDVDGRVGSAELRVVWDVLSGISIDSAVESTVGEDGATLELPGIAELTINAGATTGLVELASIRMNVIEQAAVESDVELIPVPALRIKTQRPLFKNLQLAFEIPGLADLIAQGKTPRLAALYADGSELEQLTPILSPIGGTVCRSEQALCVTLSPDQFIADNPFDPDDPILIVQPIAVVGTAPSWRIWRLNVPGDTSIVIGDRNASITFGFTFILDPNIEFTSDPLPVLTNHIFSPFGVRDDGDYPHRGIDLRALTGSLVDAAHSGEIDKFEGSETAGNFARVTTDEDWRTRYLHLDTFNSGGRDRGLGTSGNTGKSTGPHLHLDLTLFGSDNGDIRVDPSPFLSQGGESLTKLLSGYKNSRPNGMPNEAQFVLITTLDGTQLATQMARESMSQNVEFQFNLSSVDGWTDGLVNTVQVAAYLKAPRIGLAADLELQRFNISVQGDEPPEENMCNSDLGCEVFELRRFTRVSGRCESNIGLGCLAGVFRPYLTAEVEGSFFDGDGPITVCRDGDRWIEKVSIDSATVGSTFGSDSLTIAVTIDRDGILRVVTDYSNSFDFGTATTQTSSNFTIEVDMEDQRCPLCPTPDFLTFVRNEPRVLFGSGSYTETVNPVGQPSFLRTASYSGPDPLAPFSVISMTGSSSQNVRIVPQDQPAPPECFSD